MILVNISKFSSKRNTPPVYVSNANKLAALNEDVDVFRNGDIRRHELLFAQFLILNPKWGDKASFGVLNCPTADRMNWMAASMPSWPLQSGPE
jgi:hypothetical protein